MGPNPLHPDRMSPAERRAELCRILAAGLIRLRAAKSSPLSADGGESSVDLSPTEERSCNSQLNGDMHDDCRPHPRAPGRAEDHADAGAEGAVARSVRDRAAALQPALPRKPAGLPHPGTGLWRPEARDGPAAGDSSARSWTAAARRSGRCAPTRGRSPARG